MMYLIRVGAGGNPRAEHHEQMKERAKQQDVTLVDEPGPWGKGPGSGGGRGGRY